MDILSSGISISVLAKNHQKNKPGTEDAKKSDTWIKMILNKDKNNDTYRFDWSSWSHTQTNFKPACSCTDNSTAVAEQAWINCSNIIQLFA